MKTVPVFPVFRKQIEVTVHITNYFFRCSVSATKEKIKNLRDERMRQRQVVKCEPAGCAKPGGSALKQFPSHL